MSGWLLRSDDGREVAIHGHGYYEVDGTAFDYEGLPGVETVQSEVGNDLVLFVDERPALWTDDLAFIELIRQHLDVRWDADTGAQLPRPR